MSVTSNAQTTPATAGPASKKEGSFVTRGVVVTYLSVLVLIPLAAVVWQSTQDGIDGFMRAITNPQALAALRLTFLASLVVVAINIVAGTLIAWVLVRDSFRGKAIVNSLIDLPFALPTIVAGLTLLALYGPRSPLGVRGDGTALCHASVRHQSCPACTYRAGPRHGGGGGILRGWRLRYLQADHLSHTPSCHTLRGGPGFRPLRGRVRLGGPHNGQPAFQDRGRLRLHLRAGRERRDGERRGGLRRAACDLAAHTVRVGPGQPLGDAS